ncbi:hypothetical protein [Ostreiculturibacter nitratireducens]|uniref:hypothetical protein n=1 Tax=Ostreiculturibacter nitratireducens TaxID=3075226 RepID=UPI0031B613A6
MGNEGGDLFVQSGLLGLVTHGQPARDPRQRRQRTGHAGNDESRHRLRDQENDRNERHRRAEQIDVPRPDALCGARY